MSNNPVPLFPSLNLLLAYFSQVLPEVERLRLCHPVPGHVSLQWWSLPTGSAAQADGDLCWHYWCVYVSVCMCVCGWSLNFCVVGMCMEEFFFLLESRVKYKQTRTLIMFWFFVRNIIWYLFGWIQIFKEKQMFWKVFLI